jgi:DNA-binding CsgD family transcriptional regulator
MGKRKPVDFKEMRRLRDIGVTNGEIAKRLGCGETTVTDAVRHFGWPKKTTGHRVNVDVPKLFLLWHTQATLAEIAEQLGCKVTTLWTLKKRHKLPPKRRPDGSSPNDPTPQQIEERCREVRERHFARLRGESDSATKGRLWRGDEL